MPSGPGVITDAEITCVREWVGTRAKIVVLTSRVDARGIAEQVEHHRPDAIQLCDAVMPSELTRLRDACPEIWLMQVIHVRDESSVAEAMEIAPHVDAILLDSGNPGAAVKELGGTGRVHDWRLSRRIRDAIDKPLFLAGGLRADNVKAACDAVRPWGVDVCSGVRTHGALSVDRLASFVQSLHEFSFDGIQDIA